MTLYKKLVPFLNPIQDKTLCRNGDGNRVKKTEGGQTILYINQYYEKNLTTGVVTTSYYLGGQLVANRVGTILTYIHQDNLSSTSVMSTSSGTLDTAHLL